MASRIGSSFGAYGGYGVSGEQSVYAEAPVRSWAAAIAEAKRSNEDVSVSYGNCLNQTNNDAARLIRKIRQINELRASVGEFLDLFPIPTGKENQNPSLKELQDILCNRAKEEGGTCDGKPAYDSTKLDALNRMLKELGMVPMSEKSTKSDFESLRTRLDGMRDEASGYQSLFASKQGQFVGTINQFQTAIQGLIKSELEIGKSYARLVGSV